MSKLFRNWIATLDSREDRVTNFPNYPDWLNLVGAFTFAIAGCALVLSFGFLLLVNVVPGLLSLLRPLQPIGVVLGVIVAGLMVLASVLFLLFVLHAILVIISYALISLSRGTLKSLLAFARTGR
jgi:uncharacterized membrane protein (DUF485 family)